jgi:hypothetical protein
MRTGVQRLHDAAGVADLHVRQRQRQARHCNLGMKLVVSGLTYAACERA